MSKCPKMTIEDYDTLFALFRDECEMEMDTGFYVFHNLSTSLYDNPPKLKETTND